MNKNFWKIHRTKQETKNDFEKLTKAKEQGDCGSIIKILKNQDILRCFVIRRGEGSEYLKALLECFDMLFDDKVVDSRNVFALIKKNKFPEHILIELQSAAYHLRDKDHFFLFYNTMRENDFSDKEVPVFAQHTFAVWIATTENNHEKHIEANKQALEEARKWHCEIIEKKILYGLSDHKGQRSKRKLKPQKRIEDFEKLSDFFAQRDDTPDAIRAKIDQGNAYLELARLQNGEDREESLQSALTICKTAQKEARSIGYQNALALAKEVLSEVYFEKDNSKQAERYKKEAERIRSN